MKAYHVVSPDRLQSILTNGIAKESRSNKGDDKAVIKTDEYLDERRLNVLKEAIISHKNPMTLETLAKSYWDKLIPLATFEINMIRRPEIMVTYDISPQDIRPIL